MIHEEPKDIMAILSGADSIDAIIKRKSKSLEAILDAVPVGLLLIDENFIIVRVNDAIRRILAKDFKDIINKTIGQVLDCKVLTIENKNCGGGQCCKKCPLRSNIEKVFHTSQSIDSFEFQSETFFQDRSIKPWFALTVKPVMIDDRKSVVVCLNDITEQKYVEEKLIETMELKQQFISTVSHELRTPLTAIKEGLNIVLEGVAGRVNNKQKEFLELSKRNVDRLSMLINDVLDFQKFESGRMKFDFASVDMANTIKEAVETMTLMAKKGNVNLSYNIEPPLGKAVFDRNRIIQVLTNLLSNAIKFTPAGGKVTVNAYLQNNEIVITVSDTGMGIPKKDLFKVFERFYRVKRLGKEIPGTGLGLPIVAQIINRHHGTISVESELNKGTKFTVILPVKGTGDLDNAKDEVLEKTIAYTAYD